MSNNQSSITIDRLSNQLKIAYQEQFTGKLDVQATNNEIWNIYFNKGSLVWIGGDLHWQRRWQRFLAQYCHLSFRDSLEKKQMMPGEDYYLLLQWVEQGQIIQQQATLLIQDSIREVLFDILQRETHEGMLIFVRNYNEILEKLLITVEPERALNQAKKDWERWRSVNLANVFPNSVPRILRPRQLQNQMPAETYKNVVRAINGGRTLREVALLLQQTPLDLMLWLNNCIRQGWIELLNVSDESLLSAPLENLEKNTFTASLQQQPKLFESNHVNRNDLHDNDNQLPYRGRFGVSKKLASFLLLTSVAIGGSYFLWSKQSQISNFLASVLPKTASTQSTSLTVLGDTFIGYSTFRNATFQEALEKVDINLQYQDELDQAKRAELLNSGKADFLVTSLDQFLLQRPKGKIVGLIDRTEGADAVVLNTKKYPNLRSLQDLSLLVERLRSQDKQQQLSITFASDTPSEYLALLLSTKFDEFRLADLQVKKVIDASVAWQLLQDPQQDIAVAVLWEPYVTQAQKQGYTVILSSKDVPGAIVDVIIASERALRERPEQISSVLEAYYRRIDANVRNNSQFLNQIIEDSKLSRSDAMLVLQGIKFFTAKEARDWLQNSTFEKRIGSTAAVLTLTGKMTQPLPNTKELFTSEFIDKAASNTEKLISLLRADNPELAEKLSGTEKTTLVNKSKLKQSVSTALKIGNLKIRGDIKFLHDSAQLSFEGEQKLKQLAQEISEFNEEGVGIRVVGHTSQSGDPGFNQQLSQKRAEVVASYLRSQGLKHSIKAEGKGFSQPLPGIPPSDHRNQRTEIQLFRQPGTKSNTPKTQGAW